MRKLLSCCLLFSFFMSGLAYGAGDEFKLFIWSEYMPPEMPKAFEERTGLKMTCK